MFFNDIPCILLESAYGVDGNANNIIGAAMIISTQIKTFCNARPSFPSFKTPSLTRIAHRIDCQNVRKMTALTKTNFRSGLYGCRSSCAPR